MAAMRTIQVRRTLRAPADRVFDVLADHAGYAKFDGVRSAALVRPGASEPNGVGALREIRIGSARFEEEITVFERPTRMEYRIVRSRPPIAHELGRIVLTPVDGGVDVEWTSIFRVALPLIGGLATAIAARRMTKGFAATLAAVEARAR